MLLKTIHVKCVVCGEVNEFKDVASVSANGFYDLDMRPPAQKRDAIIYEVQVCKKCFYVNNSIDELIDKRVFEIIKSEKYLTIAKKDINTAAKGYLLLGEIFKYSDIEVSGWNYLKAAWVFDDLRQYDEAVDARKQAIGYFKQLLGGLEGGRREQAKAVVVDLLRRTGDFENAIKLANELLEETKDKKAFVIAAMKTQILLSKDEDDGCCNMEDVDEILETGQELERAGK